MADTGTGIPAEYLPRIFDRFYRVNEKTNIAGIGVGLAITKKIVEKHGGTIFAQSSTGKGSVFKISFNLRK